MFVNREQELHALNVAFGAKGGQLVVMWGRRRVGKTFLLQAFSERRRTLFHAATQQSAQVELAAFTETTRAVLGTQGLPTGYVFPDWTTALDFVADHAARRLVIVLDEFPYLVESSPGLESVIQRWWDHTGRRSPVMLILCGSAVSYMEQVTGAAAPLHQRATSSIRVRPLGYLDAGRFVEEISPFQRAIVYGILGGTPLYLAQWNSRKSIRENLVNLFGRPESPLVDAGELVLSGEVPELQGAFRVMQAVALGRTQAGKIADYAKVAVERPLKRLVSLGLLERRVPALEDPARSRRAMYRISDHYFAFWFRFIASSRSHISRGLGRQLIESRVLPRLDDYMGSVYEDIAREHARMQAAARTIEADTIEAWWSPDGSQEVDLVGLSGNRVSFVGSVKWSSRPLGRPALAELEAHSRSLPGVDHDTLKLLYGRSGCSDRLSGRSIRCFSTDELYSFPRIARRGGGKFE